jgi:hypothetical protein
MMTTRLVACLHCFIARRRHHYYNWLDDPVRGRFSTLDRLAASKVMYTHRF